MPVSYQAYSTVVRVGKVPFSFLKWFIYILEKNNVYKNVFIQTVPSFKESIPQPFHCSDHILQMDLCNLLIYPQKTELKKQSTKCIIWFL